MQEYYDKDESLFYSTTFGLNRRSEAGGLEVGMTR